MKNIHTFLLNAACVAVLVAASPARAHVVLDQPAGLAGTGYAAALRVSHGCDGSPTTAIKVFVPAGFQGAKPQPKPGWTLAVRTDKLAKPYTSHGKSITEDVTEITWTAASKDSWLPDAYFDEFVLRGSLPEQAGALWFRVLQTYEKGATDWAQLPASGTSTKGLKSPAALLEIIESGPAGGHQH